MILINLTPHSITVRGSHGDVTISASGNVARVGMTETPAGEVVGVSVVRRKAAGVTGLPDPQEGIGFLVSSMVLDACGGRSDVFAPDTGPTAIREDGQIVAVRRLVAAAK